MPADPDDTIRLPAPRAVAPSRGMPLREAPRGASLRPVPARRAILLGGAALLLLGAGGAAWFFLAAPPGPAADIAVRSAQPAARTAAPSDTTAPPSLAVPAFALRDREAILRWQPDVPTFVRMAERPAIFLLAFPDLAAQGRMLNRIAALIEKARTPRDRVLRDRELAAAIAADGEEPDTYYYGHDYALAEVERFFALAAAGDIPLNAEERWLLAQLPAIRAAGGTGPLALISLPNEEARFDPAMRRAVLEHEFGHGLFFTDPDYATHVLTVWRTIFTEAERAAFRSFMTRLNYDATNESLVANEAFAYFVCTPDRRFFDPRRDVGLDDPAAERLRAALRRP